MIEESSHHPHSVTLPKRKRVLNPWKKMMKMSLKVNLVDLSQPVVIQQLLVMLYYYSGVPS